MPFPIGNYIKLPANKTSEQYLIELSNFNIYGSTYSCEILKEIESLKYPQSIKIVLLSLEQLGFPDGATLQEIYDKAESMGLELLCPPQAVFELGLRYDNPEEASHVTIVTGLIGDELRTINLSYEKYEPNNHISISKIVNLKNEFFENNDNELLKFCFRKL